MGKSLRVGNLPNDVTENDLKRVFAPYGAVLSAKIVQDREPGRPYGLVEMGGDAEARAAVAGLHGSVIDGRPLTVEEATVTVTVVLPAATPATGPSAPPGARPPIRTLRPAAPAPGPRVPPGALEELEAERRRLADWEQKLRTKKEGLDREAAALEEERQKLDRIKAELDGAKREIVRESQRLHEEKKLLEEEKKLLQQDKAAIVQKKKDLFQQEQQSLRKREADDAAARDQRKQEWDKQQDELRRLREQAHKEIEEARRKARADLDEDFRVQREGQEHDVRAEGERLRALARQQLEDYRARQRAELDEEARQRREALRAEIEAERQRLREELEGRRAAADAFHAEREKAKQLLAERETVCRRLERDLKQEKAELEEARHDLDALVLRKAGAELRNLRDAAAQAEKNRAYLLSQIQELENRLLAREELDRRFGDEYTPERIKKLVDDKNAAEEKVERLQAQLNAGPPEPELERLRADAARLKEREEECDRLRQEVVSLKRDRDRQLIAVNAVEDLRNDVGRLADDNKRLRDELQGLRDLNAKKQERDARIGELNKPLCQISRPAEPDRSTEKEWLERVFGGIHGIGFDFPRRLLYAFHTCLKIAEWSPLTVLAGVSGTGKSELPRLYARFGGLQFEAVAVQPNWDSPQDLFGFYNYIDNCFNPKPFLQALAQSQRPKEDGEGFDDGLLLLLLDEMNLARVELYFSDLLSLLELRRGETRTVHLQVDLGSGLPKHLVSLGRNILFVGTMNEDETTHALSDKALDRSNVLGFPRPATLRSRDSVRLPEPEAFLPRAQWERWAKNPKDVLGESLRGRFRAALERINECLAAVRRALGHRVWQAMEAYIANHPLVGAADEAGREAAARYAFEDQLVQKVMPKLRGVETDGNDRIKCLNPIRDVLTAEAPGLVADFDAALDSPDGTFSWHSKDYLKVESGS